MNHLKWMGHQSTIYEIQKNLRNDLQSCEVTLAGKGKSVQAHRFVLSSCSDMLRGILIDIPIGQEATIMIPDIKGALLESVLAFIYMGETCLNSNNLSEFLEAINLLGIKSAISFECNTGMLTSSGNGNNRDCSASKGISSSMQIAQDEIIEEEQMASPKLEEQTVMEGSDQQTARELEFLDVYNEPQQKITYSIEHMAAATTNEFILTENSGTYTITQNTKLDDPSMTEKIGVEPEEDPEDSHMLDDYSNTAEPIIEISTASNTSVIPAGNVVTVAKPTLINLKPKIKIEQRTSAQHVHQQHHQQQQQQQAINASAVIDSKSTLTMANILNASTENYSSAGGYNDSQLRDENLEMAVTCVLNEGMSLQKAAQKYHISKTVLWRRVRKHPMYMKTTRENPLLEAACSRLRSGQSLKVISQALDIPMSTLHRHKVRLAQQGRLPDYISFKKRGAVSKEQLKEKLSKAVQACLHEGMSQNHAANLYEIPKSTLWRHLQKRMSEAQMQCLDDEEAIKEEIILS